MLPTTSYESILRNAAAAVTAIPPTSPREHPVIDDVIIDVDASSAVAARAIVARVALKPNISNQTVVQTRDAL